MKARIYLPAKSSMQSGPARSMWHLKFTPEPGARFIDKTMGWTGSNDMKQELDLRFNSIDSAIEFAKTHNIEYEVVETRERKVKKKSYADNFK